MCLIKETLQFVCLQSKSEEKPILGGDNIIVIIDLLNYHTDIQPYQKYLIGMAELKEIPMRTHFEYAEYNNNIDIDYWVQLIRSTIAPGSWIVFEDRFYLEGFRKLLSDSYPIIVRRSQLEQHNTKEQNATKNLTLVWKHALRSVISQA